MKSKSITLAISAAIAVAAGIAASQAQMTPNNKLRMAEAAIAQLYVDTVNEDRLVEDAIKGILEGSTLIRPTPRRRRRKSLTSRCRATSAA